MSSTKKKSKIAKIPKPIKVKKEKTEDNEETLYPMSHYIDDRLELTKQIISTLKPKTITNLAPDFLKERSLEDIEELCLNELLGISTKRLLSIINATKCPTDTESSSDSDVNNIEEHISLEEISSDSEVEKNLKSPAKTKSSKNSTSDGKINVLELLELQARARAIRSQLALEPVTKIDVDSDDEPVSKNTLKEHKRSNNKINSKTSVLNLEKAKNSTNGIAANSATTENTSRTVVAKQKIKLKRNFRKRTEINDDEESRAETSKVQDSISDAIIKEEKRSQSPDVIPILPVTETLYISDSSSDEMPLPEKGEEINKQGLVDNSDKANKTCQQKEPSEAEDGEITDDDDPKKKQGESEKIDMLNKTAEIAETQPVEANESDKVVVSGDEPPVSEVAENGTCNENSKKKVEADEMVKTQQPISNKPNEPDTNSIDIAQTADAVNESHNIEIIIGECSEVDDNEHNDDVISIEGGDLESEMKEHLEESKSIVLKTLPRETSVEIDVITLDDSSSEEYNDELKKSESWNARWLKSSKVSKVLATSRLGNRLRDKIKKSKRSQKLARQEEEELAQKNLITSVVISRHELGSVDQYKELAEMQKRI